MILKTVIKSGLIDGVVVMLKKVGYIGFAIVLSLVAVSLFMAFSEVQSTYATELIKTQAASDKSISSVVISSVKRTNEETEFSRFTRSMHFAPTFSMQPSRAYTWTGPRGVSSTGNEQIGPQRPAADDIVSVIVQMEQPPTLVYNAAQSIDLHEPLASRQVENIQRYTNALKQSHQGVVLFAHNQGIPLKMQREYVRAFNGFAGEIRWGDWKKISTLPGVAAVFLNEQVNGVLQESVPLIRADQVWADLGVNGAGIVVGMVDSGIDYTHPDLGGCLGSGCKIIGGYDFVNNDADPWDDNGHGTHTAGIVAADGITTTGVAPGASLMALKVLNADNWGSWDDILAALDYAVDPDGDPGTDDAPDLLSMSIGGGTGNPDDPIAQAVDNVVASGIPCIIAAGNAGPNYNTMQTPGGSRLAITVGGSSKQDDMYWYSSRGHISQDYIKPDIIAPGVSVCSTIPGSSYDCWNGTSMATPHVAGVVALLRQLHPSWGPSEIKGAMMGSAVDLGFDAFSQGAGRVDAYAAALALGGFTPPSLHLGAVDIYDGIWTSTTTLPLTNLYSQPLTYALSVNGLTFTEGVTATVFPSEITLSPGEMQSVTLQIAVNASVVPNVSDPPYVYEGDVLAQTDLGVVYAPFVFAKGAQLIINYQDDPWMVKIHNRASVSYDLPWNPGAQVSLFVQPDTYDIMTVFDDGVTVVVQEGIVVTRTTEITLSHADAPHTVNFQPLDEKGDVLPGRDWWRVIRFRDTNLWTGAGWSLSIPGYYSDLSSDYRIEWVDMSYTLPLTQSTQYFIKEHLIGLTQSITLSNNPADLYPVHITHHLPPTQTVLHQASMAIQMSQPTDWWLMYSPYHTVPLVPPFTQTLYFEPAGTYPYVFGYNSLLGFQNASWTWGEELFSTPFLRAGENSLQGFRYGVVTPTVTSVAGRWETGLTPAWWNGRFDNSGDNIHVAPATGWDYYLFFDQYDNVSPDYNYPFTLTRTGGPVSAGAFTWDMRDVAVSPDIYTLTVTHPSAYFLAERPVTPEVVTVFDTRLSDPNPPYLTAFRLLVDNIPTNTLTYGEVGYIEATIVDNVAIADVSVSWQPLSGGVWQTMPIWSTGEQWRATLPDDLVAGDYALRLTVIDTSDNTLIYTVAPGWRVVGMPTAQVSTFTAEPNVGYNPLTVHFTATTPGPVMTYTWDFGDGSTADTITPTHTYIIPGQYTVTLTIAGPGWSGTRVKPAYITVNPVQAEFVDEYKIFLPIIINSRD